MVLAELLLLRHKKGKIEMLTKTQIRKMLNDLFDKGCLGKLLNAIITAEEELESVIYDVEDTRDSIEPYENRDELTEKQQEKYEWCDELLSDLDELKSDIEDWEYTLNTKEDYLKDRE